jgi:hypothetical protein
MPKATLIAIEEFEEGRVHHRKLVQDLTLDDEN